MPKFIVSVGDGGYETYAQSEQEAELEALRRLVRNEGVYFHIEVDLEHEASRHLAELVRHHLRGHMIAEQIGETIGMCLAKLSTDDQAIVLAEVQRQLSLPRPTIEEGETIGS